MKYKFLMRMYKSCKNEMSINIKDKSLISVIKTNFYEIFYKYVFLFKENNKNLNCNCLDKLLDEAYLTGDIISDNIDKEYKALRKYIKDLSLYDFKILHKFRLSLETVLVEIDPMDIADVELNMVLTFLATIVLICEGGVLYLPIEYRQCKLNLSKELDSFVDLKIDSNKHPLVQYGSWTIGKLLEGQPNVSLTNGQKVTLINSVLKKFIDNEFSAGFGVHYLFLLDLAFSLSNKAIRKVIENYITEDVFKYNVGYYTINIQEQPTLLNRFRLNEEEFDNFYDRKFLLPSSGICIKIPNESDSNILACECDDDVFGRRLFWFLMCDGSKFYAINDIHLETRYGTMRSYHNGTTTILDLLDILNKFDENTLNFKGISISKSSEDGCYYRHEKNSVAEELTYEVYQPTYWKYKGQTNNSTCNTHSPSNKLYAEEIKKLSPFKRNLPAGQKRSEEATELAKKLCINLADNETVVGEFERKQRVRIDNKMNIF